MHAITQADSVYSLAAEENREKSRESRNSRESGISNWSSPIGGVFYPRQQRGVQEPN